VVKLELQNNNTTEETTIMSKDTRTLGKIVQIDDARIRDHLGELVRGTVEETLNAMLVAARLRHIAGTKWGTRRYLSMEALEKQLLEKQHSA